MSRILIEGAQHDERGAGARMARFYGVGALGIGVQFAVLTFLAKIAHLPVSIATVVAVAVTVAHNFAWHERYTFDDRIGNQRTLAGIAARYVRFNLANGVISLLGNVVFTTLLAQYAHLPLLVANAISIGLCGLLNYVASDRLVFRNRTSRKTNVRAITAATM